MLYLSRRMVTGSLVPMGNHCLLPGEVLKYALMLPAFIKDLPYQVILQQVQRIM